MQSLAKLTNYIAVSTPPPPPPPVFWGGGRLPPDCNAIPLQRTHPPPHQV
eukprot:COSAG06_NODE_6882_length_2730_cov_3.681870_4_plen_49_part_01